jgi:hypothetical protein
MDLEKVRIIIEDKYAELTDEVIETLKGMTVESDEEDAPPYTIWEDFVDLVQDEAEYSDYDDLISETCLEAMEQLSPLELKLLWLGSGGCLDWEEAGQEADFPDMDQIQQDVGEELFSWIEQKAAEDDLELFE